MTPNPENLRSTSLRFVIGVLFLFTLGIGMGACSARRELTEPTSSPAEPKLTRSISVVGLDEDVELIAAGSDVPAIASQRFVYAASETDPAVVTIFQSVGSLRETIAEVDVPVTPMKDSNIVITVSVDSQKQMRLKTSVMETAVVNEYGPFPVE